MMTKNKQASFFALTLFVPISKSNNIPVPESYARRACAGFAQLGIYKNLLSAAALEIHLSIQELVELL